MIDAEPAEEPSDYERLGYDHIVYDRDVDFEGFAICSKCRTERNIYYPDGADVKNPNYVCPDCREKEQPK